MIYFALAPTAGMVKIGFAKNPDARFAILRAGSPVELVLLGSIPGDYTFERRLHAYLFSRHHHNEWFRCDTFVARAINELLAGCFDMSKLPEKSVRASALTRRLRKAA